MPEAGLEPGTIRSTVHCLIHYATKGKDVQLDEKVESV